MPYSRPTLTQLRNTSAQQLDAALPGADAQLRFSNLRVIGDIDAALACMLYGYLDWIARQAVPFTAEDEYLEAWGALKGVTRKSCSQAGGQIAFSGADGRTIGAGAGITRSDGVAYTATGTAEVAGGVVTVTAAAVPDPQGLTGSNGNCAAGTRFTLSNAIAGIDSTGTAVSPFTGGADIETNDEYRTRVLLAYQTPPQGGATGDYVAWALAVPGVTRAWCTGNGYGPGTIVVYIMLDDANAASGGFPQGTDGVSQFDAGPDGNPRGVVAGGDQLAVADALIDEQPVTALVYVCSPIPNALGFTVAGLANADPLTQQAVAAALAALFLTAHPGATVDISDINIAIGSVPGTAGFIITAITSTVGDVTVSLPLTENIAMGTGELPGVGVLTWI